MAKLGTYDAILADIRLPDLPGYEVYRSLREAQPRARVILMTSYGYDPSHSIVKARQDGLRSVLYKPFRVDQLLDALTQPDKPADKPVPGTARTETVPV
jgi:CheY-like chemotaxis protein